MDDQRANPEVGGGVRDAAPIANHQFNLRRLFVVASWVALWIGAWVWICYLNHHVSQYRMLPVVTCATVVTTCPIALFGYLVGRAKAGLIAGLITSALVYVLAYLTI
jgi:hypothetical protein